jgi:hypothetical protein
MRKSKFFLVAVAFCFMQCSPVPALSNALADAAPPAAPPSAVVDCGSLKGVGAVALTIDSVRYVVLVQCPAPALTSI